jgi:hypothetical protein
LGCVCESAWGSQTRWSRPAGRRARPERGRGPGGSRCPAPHSSCRVPTRSAPHVQVWFDLEHRALLGCIGSCGRRTAPGPARVTRHASRVLARHILAVESSVVVVAHKPF